MYIFLGDMERILAKLSQESQGSMQLREQNNILTAVVKEKDLSLKRLASQLTQATQAAADNSKLKAVTDQLIAAHVQCDAIEEELAEAKETAFLG